MRPNLDPSPLMGPSMGRAEGGRPYRGTPLHSIRLDDEVWARVTAHATEHGLTASDVIRDLITTLPTTKEATE